MKNKLHDLPFLNADLVHIYAHAKEVGAVIATQLDSLPTLEDQCRTALQILHKEGLLQYSVAPMAIDDANPITAGLEVLALRLVCQALAEHHALADFAFAMQGLGSIPMHFFRSVAHIEQYLIA